MTKRNRWLEIWKLYQKIDPTPLHDGINWHQLKRFALAPSNSEDPFNPLEGLDDIEGNQ